MSVAANMEQLACRARAASRRLAAADTASKNRFLQRLSELLLEREGEVMAANALDVASAREAGLDAPRLDRLALAPATMLQMRRACEDVAAMPDPVGAMESQWRRPNGLLVGRMRIPLGVIAIIYEARPNVTIDAAILCVKAGNAVLLRGGSEAGRTNAALAALLQTALAEAGLPRECAQAVGGGHEAVQALCKLDQYIDVMIPRGGESLVRAVSEAARMPVLRHYKGVCHAYVDNGADLEEACRIVINAKTQRPGVCNALEALLVHGEVAADFLPMLAARLSGVEFRACERALPLLGPAARPQKPEDLGHEFHDLILAVRVVDGMDEALDHIDRYGSRHTDIICTRDYANAMRFVREADASMVAVNASTRFNDGGELGLGAEIGISTSKLHAFGPMGVRELTSAKFVVFGSGQVRE